MDTTQYFHSKHLSNLPKRHEKNLFAKDRCFRAQKIFSRIYCKLLLRLLIGLYDQNLVKKEDFDIKSDLI